MMPFHLGAPGIPEVLRPQGVNETITDSHWLASSVLENDRPISEAVADFIPRISRGRQQSTQSGLIHTWR
jgi:hypothetical protein